LPSPGVFTIKDELSAISPGMRVNGKSRHQTGASYAMLNGINWRRKKSFKPRLLLIS